MSNPIITKAERIVVYDRPGLGYDIDWEFGYTNRV